MVRLAVRSGVAGRGRCASGVGARALCRSTPGQHRRDHPVLARRSAGRTQDCDPGGARRGTFSYAFTDVATGKDYLQTVNVLTGQTVARIALPSDVTGLEVVHDVGPLLERRSDKDAMIRKIEALEQEVRRLQGPGRSR